MKKELLFIMLMENKNSLTIDVVQRHVEHLRMLDNMGKLFACGPFIDYHGGMVILKADSMEEAHNIAKSDPFIQEGYKSYEIRTMEWAKKENNYGLMDTDD